MAHMDTGENIDRILPNMVNANVYYGVEPILECLEGGADIIILGRSTDTAMFEAPLIHVFRYCNWTYVCGFNYIIVTNIKKSFNKRKNERILVSPRIKNVERLFS